MTRIYNAHYVIYRVRCKMAISSTRVSTTSNDTNDDYLMNTIGTTKGRNKMLYCNYHFSGWFYVCTLLTSVNSLTNQVSRISIHGIINQVISIYHDVLLIGISQP